MKMLRNIGLGLLAIATMAFTAKLKDGNYSVSIKESKVEWVGKKVTGRFVRGRP